MESRPYDAALDPTFYSGGSKAQVYDCACVIFILLILLTLLYTVVFQPAQLAQASTAAVVSGTNRYSHHHHFRPRMPHMNVIPPQVLLAPSAEVDPSIPAVKYSTTADVSVQTVFRESEAQTDPYTPEVSIDPNKPTPEVPFKRYIHMLRIILFFLFLAQCPTPFLCVVNIISNRY